jgi:hypothetical protein
MTYVLYLSPSVMGGDGGRGGIGFGGSGILGGAPIDEGGIGGREGGVGALKGGPPWLPFGGVPGPLLFAKYHTIAATRTMRMMMKRRVIIYFVILQSRPLILFSSFEAARSRHRYPLPPLR